MAQEKPGQTLQATALVHEAYIRLVDVEKAQHWDSRGHFFAAAAEAMRRILVENARRKERAEARGRPTASELWSEIAAIRGAEQTKSWPRRGPRRDWPEGSPETAELVKLRFFAGLSLREAAESARHIALNRLRIGLTPKRGCVASWGRP